MEFVLQSCFAAPAAALQQCLAPAEPPIAAPVTAETSSAPIASAYVVSAPTAAAPIASKAEPLAAPSFNANELKALADPPLFAEYGELHKRALAYMRSRRDAAVAAEPNMAPSAEMASDVRLMRFLIAKSFDCAGAAEMYIGALQWRRDAKIDAYRNALVVANAAFFTKGASSLKALGLNGRDQMLENVQPRTFTMPHGKGEFELLRDKQGNLVYIECPGLISAPDVLSLDPTEYTAAIHESQELLQLVLDELSRRAGKLVLILRVIDMSEMRLIKFMQSKQEKEGEKLVKDAGKPFADAYPTTTYKNFLINLPAAAGAAAPIIKAVVPARSAKKIVLLGSKFTEELHKEVEPAMLPKTLGGSLDDGRQWERRKK